MEGSNEKQIHSKLDLSKHREDPGTKACSIKGWKGHWNGHLREFIARSSRQGHQLPGLPARGQLLHVGHREKATGRGMGRHRPKVQERSLVASP